MHGMVALALSKIPGLTYEDIYSKIPWGVILRMVADLPGQRKVSKEEIENRKIKTLTPQTSKDFKSFMNRLGAQQKD